jgi:hypothetical protein
VSSANLGFGERIAWQLAGTLIASLSPVPAAQVQAGCTDADSANRVFGFGARLVLGWPGRSTRGRSAASKFAGEVLDD